MRFADSGPSVVEFVVEGEPNQARDLVDSALEERKFILTWSDPWTAVAERGNRVANAIVGAPAQYFKLGVMIRTGQPGHTVIDLVRLSSGLMGGLIGAARTKRPRGLGNGPLNWGDVRADTRR